MSNKEIPVWEKYCLTIKEAMEYFNIGRDTMYELSKTPDAPFILRNGRNVLIKRKAFEKYLDSIRDIG